MLDSAIEITSDADTEAANTRPEVDVDFRTSTPSNSRSSSNHDRSQSFSFGQTVFHSLAGGRESPVLAPILNSSSTSRRGSLKPKGNRSRAYSDTVFHSVIQGSPVQKENVPPEADIDDRSNGAIVMYAAGSPPKEKEDVKEKEKDPFGAHSTAYYTPGTGVPPTPPQSAPVHQRKASREEDLILSLRTQLALQSELCAQYEVDFRGRDELLRMVQAKFDECQRECERRKNVIRGWRKRVAELERCVHGLQEEVDRSREESAERSVMDEASGQALRSLHGRIKELEREKMALEQRERAEVEELDTTRAELSVVKEELSRRDERERALQDGIARAREQMDEMDMSISVEEAERSRAFSTVAWDEERKALLAANEALRADKLAVESQLADAREEVLQKDGELGVLKAELEAQWKGTEASSEQIAELEKERDELREEVEALHTRIGEIEIDWTQSENRKNELEAEMQDAWTAKEELAKERAEVSLLGRSQRS